MHLWSFLSSFGLMPYPKAKYFNIIRIILPLTLLILWTKLDLIFFANDMDVIQSVLYLYRGFFEISVILIHNWSIISHPKEIGIIMNAERIPEIGLARSLIFSMLHSIPQIVFIIFIGFDSDTEQPLTTGNLCFCVLDAMVILIVFQYNSILQCLTNNMRLHMISGRSLITRANKVLDIIDVGRSVEIIYRKQAFFVSFKVMYQSLYGLYIYVRFIGLEFPNKAYRVANIITQLSTMFFLVNECKNFRNEVS